MIYIHRAVPEVLQKVPPQCPQSVVSWLPHTGNLDTRKLGINATIISPMSAFSFFFSLAHFTIIPVMGNLM